MDEVIALGARNFIACGGCGVLDKQIGVGQILLPEAALRDEGTSYHYLPPSAEVQADPVALASIKATLQAHEIPYLRTKTWSTDGYYRETPRRVEKFRAMGCLAVEIEAAAFMAVAQFRQVHFGQLFMVVMWFTWMDGISAAGTSVRISVNSCFGLQLKLV